MRCQPVVAGAGFDDDGYAVERQGVDHGVLEHGANFGLFVRDEIDQKFIVDLQDEF